MIFKYAVECFQVSFIYRTPEHKFASKSFAIYTAYDILYP